MGASRPAWCESDVGEGPVLVIAPHGGLGREDLLSAAAAGRRSNDLHTAGLAPELAARLGAARLINAALDRNRLDLNRLGEVVAHAPWFLREIEDHLERILRRHTTAVVLFVHGWHVGQARCDLGIGASLETVGEVEQRVEHLTVSPVFARRGLESLRHRLEAAGILATYGERWPAAHRNNLMRIFRRRPIATAPSRRLARWVAERRIEAVQLELGAPLRWPGPTRGALVDGIARTFGPSPEEKVGRASAVAPVPVARGSGDSQPQALVLQAFDARAGSSGLGIVMGAMRVNRTDVGARLQLFPGGQEMGIFTGHGRAGGVLGVPGLRFEPASGGFDVRFDGHLLRVDDGAAYFRWEESQAAARLSDASLRLEYREHAAGFGAVRGHVAIAGERFAIDTWAFFDRRLATPGGEGEGLRLVAALDGAPPVRVQAIGAAEGVSLFRLERDGWRAESAAGRIVDESATGLAVELSDGRRLRVRARTRVAQVRPVARRRHVHATFGIASVEWEASVPDGSARGTGFFERRRPL